MLEISFVLGILAFLASLWVLRCNTVTLKQLLHLIDLIHHSHLKPYSHEEVMGMYAELESVSYHTHLLALFFLRDPKKLYSERLQKLLEG